MHRQNILVAVDIVVFTVIKGQLNILLVKRKNDPFRGMQALPGGIVQESDRSIEEAAYRELAEETGVKEIFIKKLTAYGNATRDPRGWTVSTVFMAIIDSERFTLKATTDALEAEWFNVNTLKTLAFDHMQILKDAVSELKYEIQTTNIASQLLPIKFTLTELQLMYESILEIKLDKRNFRKRIKAMDILLPLKEQKMEGAHRPAQLFKFKQKEYLPLREKIHVFV